MNLRQIRHFYRHLKILTPVTHSVPHSVTYSVPHSVYHSVTHSVTPSVPHSVTDSSIVTEVMFQIFGHPVAIGQPDPYRTEPKRIRPIR